MSMRVEGRASMRARHDVTEWARRAVASWWSVRCGVSTSVVHDTAPNTHELPRLSAFKRSDKPSARIKVLSEYCRAVGPRRELDSMARAKYIGIVLASVTLLRVAVANEAEPRALQTCLKSGVEFGFPGTAGSDDIFLSWSMFWTRISHSPDVRNSSLCSRAHSLSSGWSALYL